MIDITRLRQLALALAIAIVCCDTTALALPPLGLTQVNSGFGRLEIIDGTAYLSGKSGVQTVAFDGSLGTVSITHPSFSVTGAVTRVVKAVNGELYVAANFSSNGNFPFAAALFRLHQPTTPIVTWSFGSVDGVDGVDVSLRTLGNRDTNLGNEAISFLLNGTTEALSFPPGSDNSNNGTLLNSTTPQGYALGEAGIPMTAGSGPVLWTPQGDIVFLNSGFGAQNSIRDRTGGGVNIGLHDFDSPIVLYGDGRIGYIWDENGNPFYGDEFINSYYFVNVSHGNFVTFQYFDSRGERFYKLYGFFPGIVPGHNNRAVPLLDIFPELATVDIDIIHDLASVDGYLYMTLSGSGGTFLFGARDPSVIVPEPATALLILAAIPWLYHRQTLVRNA